MKDLTTANVRELLLKATAISQLSTLFSLVCNYGCAATPKETQFVAIKAVVEVGAEMRCDS